MATIYEEKILGFDIGGTNMRVGVVQNKKINEIAIEKIENKHDEQAVFNQLYKLIDKVWADDVKAMGIGVPTIVDVEKGIIYDTANIPAWKEVHLKEILENKYHRPVFINNDANCFAVGEKYFGKGQNSTSMVGLITGTGMGAGLILDGRLYSGKNCAAGEVGILPYLEHDYEYYCAGGFFDNTFGVSAYETFQNCELNNATALDHMKVYGKHLSEGIKMVLYAYDVDTIVLGGSVSKAYKYYKESLWQNLEATIAYKSQLKNLQIIPTELDNVAILGAASLYYDATLKSK